MALKKSICPALKGLGNHKAEESPTLPNSSPGTGPAGAHADSLMGSSWCSSVVPSKFEALRQALDILEHTVLDIPRLDEGVVDPKGFTYKVA